MERKYRKQEQTLIKTPNKQKSESVVQGDSRPQRKRIVTKEPRMCRGLVTFTNDL